MKVGDKLFSDALHEVGGLIVIFDCYAKLVNDAGVRELFINSRDKCRKIKDQFYAAVDEINKNGKKVDKAITEISKDDYEKKSQS